MLGMLPAPRHQCLPGFNQSTRSVLCHQASLRSRSSRRWICCALSLSWRNCCHRCHPCHDPRLSTAINAITIISSSKEKPAVFVVFISRVWRFSPVPDQTQHARLRVAFQTKAFFTSLFISAGGRFPLLRTIGQQPPVLLSKVGDKG